MLTLVASHHAIDRRAAVDQFLDGLATDQECLLVARRRAPLDEIVFERTRSRGVTFGLRRTTLRRLATELALPELDVGFVPMTRLTRDAVVAAAVAEVLATSPPRDEREQRALESPGFVKALGETLAELDRVPDVRGTLRELASRTTLGTRLEALHAAYEARLVTHRVVPERTLFELAIRGASRSELFGLPLVVYDVHALETHEAALLLELIRASPRSVATTLASDHRSKKALEAAAGSVEASSAARHAEGVGAFALSFAEGRDPATPITDVRLFGGAGEGLEAAGVARAVLDEAASGVPFDRMAIVLPGRQLGSSNVARALRRAGVAGHFEEGVRTPDPGGRALLALLACRVERGSPARLFEYLSIARVGPGPRTPTAPLAEVELSSPNLDLEADEVGEETAEDAGEERAVEGGDVAVAPTARRRFGQRRWLELLSELGLAPAGLAQSGDRAAPIAAPLARLLTSFVEAETRALPSRSAAGAEEDGIRAGRVQLAEEILRDLVPVLRRLDAIPERGRYDELLRGLVDLAEAALFDSTLVRSTLEELLPLVGRDQEIELSRLIGLLGARLSWLEARARGPGYGKLLVTTPEGIAGRTREVVFVMGLADGTFPASPREDPIAPDECRLAVGLPTNEDRYRGERLRLSLALSAATRRVYLSYPRTDLSAGRGRVPSAFFAEAHRLVTGRVATLGELVTDAKRASEPSLLWPSPAAPERAIDFSEVALAHLRRYLATDGGAPRGAARFLLERAPFLRQALVSRFRRSDELTFGEYDGLRLRDDKRLLEGRSATERPYAPSTLELYAACPYRFYLRAVLGLRPLATRATLEDRLEPRVFGDLYHRCQALLTRELERAELDVREPAHRDAILEAVTHLARSEGARLAELQPPRVRRVFEGEVARLERELGLYVLELMADARAPRPLRGDAAFGLPTTADSDRVSSPEPVVLPNGLRLKGALDAVEALLDGTLRVTDFKTGKMKRDLKPHATVGGGEMLQPLLYAFAAEALEARAGSPRSVTASRLFYSSEKGGRAVEIAVDAAARALALEVYGAIDEAIVHGDLLASPRKDACKTCPFTPVCGPGEELRTANRKADRVPALTRLAWVRSRP
jgi:ATP-dependent helicase/nuclease subunit B